jgi:hypothetical protein
MKVLLCLLSLVFITPAFGGLITNGTFDSNCAGWALAQTDGFTCSATEGNPGSALVLNNGPGPVPQASQTVAGLVLGSLYRITLDAKSHYDCCDPVGGTPGSGVGIDGQQFDFLIVNFQPWTTYTFDFTYGGGDNTFVISSQRNGTDADGEFDNVDITLLSAAVTGVPEPSSLLLMAAGLVAIGASKFRKK